MPQLSPAIEGRALRKEYGPKVAVAGLTLTVEHGEIFGFLGPNGAGKTTAVKMFLGLVRPTSGQGSLLGVPITEPRCRQRVGFLPEHFRFHEWLRADEFLDLYARLHRVPKDERSRRSAELLELVGLREVAGRRLSTFSKGMLQRIGLAQSLICDPELVFLDEPTSGLDPLGRRMVRDVLQRLRERDVTVFLNSHLLSEVELTCTRVAFITDGRVREVASLGDRRDGLLQVDVRVGSIGEGLVEGLRRWSEHIDVNAEKRVLTMRLSDDSALPEIARWIVGRGTDLYSLSPRQMSLEDLFVSIVGKEDSCETS